MTPELPHGSALRPKSALLAGALLLVAFLLSIIDERGYTALPFAAVLMLLSVACLLDALGVFEDERAPRHSVAAKTLLRPSAALGLSVVLSIGALRVAVAGVLPYPRLTASALVTGAALLVLGSFAWLLGLVCGRGSGSKLTSPGLWLLTVGVALYLPDLGSFSLIDPWETHYAEVAREILARNDWISLWWAQDGFFYSKPVLTFWLEALSFLAFGVNYEPDRVIAPRAAGAFPEPEWAVRAPGVALSLLAVYLAYRAVRRAYGARVGFIAALVLTTAPYWFFLAHQGMTDMLYVAPMTGALALAALGLLECPERRVESYEVVLGRRRLRLSLAALLLATVALSALPQIAYLFSRNVSLYVDGEDRGFNVHADGFFAGSGEGNCGLPGNVECGLVAPEFPVFQPAFMGVLWAIALGVFLFVNRGERRVSRLCFLGAWYLTALAALAKGAPGLVLPLFVTLSAVVATKRLRTLQELELPGLVLLFSCVALPWYVQAFLRHGSDFTDRLLFHDMYKRAFVHVHDTNAGEDVSVGYYLWQLGYGVFPWTGLAAPALVGFVRGGNAAKSRARAFDVLLGLWAVLGFSMFAVSRTKFHHYALPVAPPLCLLTGILLARLAAPARSSEASAVFGLIGLVAGGFVAVVGRELFDGGNARLMHLFVYNYGRPWPATLDFSLAFRVFAACAACASALFMVPRLRAHAACALVVTSVCFALFCLHVYLVRAAPHWGQRDILRMYYAERASPDEPVVAYQLNWKGENFYTGNRIPVFVRSGAPFQEFIAGERERGVRVIFFTTEPGRVSTLKLELGAVRRFQVLTTPELNNKFVLVRAEL